MFLRLGSVAAPVLGLGIRGRVLAIVHFIGPMKPWTFLCRHPLRALYADHARATPWGVAPLEGRTLRNAVLRQLPMVAIDRWFATERWLQRKLRGLRRRLGLAI